MTDALWTCCDLDDETLIHRLKALVGRDRKLSAHLLMHLAEVDVRGLFRDRGYSSLFGYCVQGLQMSEGEAALRIRAARTARKFPKLFERVEQGEVHLSAIGVLSPVLTEDNQETLISAAVRKTKVEVEELVASHRPGPAAKDMVRKLPDRCSPPQDRVRATRRGSGHGSVTASLFEREAPASTETKEGSDASHGEARPQPARVTPLGQERYRIQLTADRALRDKLEAAKALMRHQVPDGDLNAILDRALGLLVDKLRKEHFGQVKRPRAKTRPTRQGSRHIPSHVRREVAARDGMRCSFVGTDGHRCTETGMLEFHHEDPYARGGPPTEANIRLMCHSHNALLAEWDFGQAFMRSKQQRARSHRVQPST